jgi:hypothetical protein
MRLLFVGDQTETISQVHLKQLCSTSKNQCSRIDETPDHGTKLRSFDSEAWLRSSCRGFAQLV